MLQEVSFEIHHTKAFSSSAFKTLSIGTIDMHIWYTINIDVFLDFEKFTEILFKMDKKNYRKNCPDWLA